MPTDTLTPAELAALKKLDELHSLGFGNINGVPIVVVTGALRELAALREQVAKQPDWICRECQRPGNAADEVGMGRCPGCGHEIDELDELAGARATIAGLRGQLADFQTLASRIDGVYGALADAATVPVHINDPGESVRELTAERDRLREQLTAERAARERLVAEWRRTAGYYEDGGDAGAEIAMNDCADQLAALDKAEGA